MAENGSEYGQNGGNIEENRDFQMFFSNTLVEKLQKYLIIIDIGSLQFGKESFLKMDFRSNGKMAENGSGNGQNGGEIDENWEFQFFFPNKIIFFLRTRF